jgi:hypothetical protein
LLLLASLALAATTFAQGLTPGEDVNGEWATPPAAHDPTFGQGFAQLHDQIGEIMGTPIEGEHPVADADAVQRTTTGLAVWRKGEPPSFTDGWRTWKLELPQPVQVLASAPPAQAAAPPQTGPPSSVWTRLAACESGGNWATNSGNGYYGGLQEDMTFWRNYGGTAYASRPDLASASAQIAVAQRGQAVQGYGAWPACSRRLGLR